MILDGSYTVVCHPTLYPTQTRTKCKYLDNFTIGPATRCDETGQFDAIFKLLEASQTIADHRSLPQVSPPKSQQCGQSTTHDGMFPLSPAMLFAAMVIRNNYLRILPNISDDRTLDAHSNVANRVSIA